MTGNKVMIVRPRRAGMATIRKHVQTRIKAHLRGRRPTWTRLDLSDNVVDLTLINSLRTDEFMKELQQEIISMMGIPAHLFNNQTGSQRNE